MAPPRHTQARLAYPLRPRGRRPSSIPIPASRSLPLCLTVAMFRVTSIRASAVDAAPRRRHMKAYLPEGLVQVPPQGGLRVLWWHRLPGTRACVEGNGWGYQSTSLAKEGTILCGRVAGLFSLRWACLRLASLPGSHPSQPRPISGKSAIGPFWPYGGGSLPAWTFRESRSETKGFLLWFLGGWKVQLLGF